MLWVDEQAGGKDGPAFWFPSLWAQQRLAASGVLAAEGAFLGEGAVGP